jgi:hypothetical protein
VTYEKKASPPFFSPIDLFLMLQREIRIQSELEEERKNNGILYK